MNPMVAVLSAVVAATSAAPTAQVLAPTPLAVASPLTGLGLGVAPALAVAPAVAPALPAPYTTSHVQGEAQVSLAQAPQQVTKQIHYGTQTYVAGYNTEVLKPAIPDISIAVPTALKGTQQINPAVVTVQKKTHVVQEPYAVDKPYNVPYEVLKHVEKVVEVPTPVHVKKPYAVPHPYPVRGEDIVKVTKTAPIIKHTHHAAVAPAIYAHAPAAQVAYNGWGAAPLAAGLTAGLTAAAPLPLAN